MRASGLPVWLAMVLTLAAASGAQAQLRYRVEAIGILGPDNATGNSVAYGLNNHGAVVGFSHTDGDSELFRAFVYEKGQIRGLGQLNGLTATEAFDINDHGQIVGYASTREGFPVRPFLYDQGHLKDLNPDPNPRNFGYAHAINESGLVTGRINTQSFVHDGTQLRFIPFGNEVLSSIPRGINDHGVVVGFAELEEFHSRAFVWDGTSVTLLPVPPDAWDWTIEGSDINNAGQILVQTNERAFLYEGGAYQDLGSLRGSNTYASAINEKGWVTGSSEVGPAPYPYHAFVWRNGRMRDLNDLLDPATAQRWDLHSATDINDRGQIIGNGTVDGLSRAFIATPVPEPSPWALLLAGLGGVGIVVGHRRRANA